MVNSIARQGNQIDHSVGVILPRKVLARLKVQKGDSPFVTDRRGGVALRPHVAVFAAWLRRGLQPRRRR